MIQQKKCNGIDLAFGFPGCGKMIKVENRKFGICKECLKLWLTTTEKGSDYMNRAMRITKKAHEKENPVIKPFDKKQHKKDKEALKTLSDYKRDLQKEINTIIRLIDKGHACIATGSFEGKMNAGHYIGVGANDTTRFHLENIWLQSEHSNSWKSGDTLRYQDGIINLFGQEYLDYMNSFKMIPVIKLSISDLKEKIIICRLIIKELKSCDRIFSKMDRITIRKELNAKIGIYE